VSWNKGKGETLKWLQDRVEHDGGDCLLWPFSRDTWLGRGRVSVNRKCRWAHRVMCELAHGAPPTPAHHAAHTCGNGHGGCVNPKHLEWKTASENAQDRRTHGTHVSSRAGKFGKLTPKQVLEIHAMKGKKTQWELAHQYGVSDNAIRNIFAGRTWRSVTHIP
jgi:hypothetical protein